MYHLLIEAGGVQQLQRIQPDWSETFFASVDKMAADHGFAPVTREGDWLLFAWNGDRIPEPEAVVRYIQRAEHDMKEASEALLGYAIVLDYIDEEIGGTATRLARMLGYLRRTDRENGTWLTPPAHRGVKELVETTEVGSVALVAGYRTNQAEILPDYTTAVFDQSFCDSVRQRLDERSGGGYSGRISVTGDDLQQLVCNVIAACTDPDGTAPLVVGWRHVDLLDEVSALDRAILVSVRDEQRLSRINRSDDHLLLADYRRRFAARSNTYLSPGWETGELRVAALQTVALVETERRPIMVTIDSNEMPVRARDALDRLLPNDSAVTVVDCVLHPQSAGRAADVVLERGEPAWSVAGASNERVTGRYWRTLAAERGGTTESGSALAALLETYDDNFATALWIWTRSRDVLVEETSDMVFPACGISLAERSRIREEFRRCGVVLDRTGFDLSPELEMETVEARLGDMLPDIRNRFASALLELIEAGQCNLTPSVWRLVQEDAPRPVRFTLWHRLVHALAVGGAPTLIEQLATPDIETDRVMTASVLSAQVRAGLRDSIGPTELADDAANLMALANDESLPLQVRIDALLTYGEYDLAIRAYENALDYAKRAMYLSQSDGRSGNGESHLLMARIMLARRRVADAGSYLNYARELAEGRDQATLFVATVFELIRLFLHGNLSGVERGATSLEPALRDAGFTEWLVLVGFLRGRVAFELGDYENARCRFVELAQFCVDCGMHAPGSVAAAWQLRASGFQGRPLDDLLAAFSMLGNRAEALLFSAEATIRAGEFESALPTLDRVLALERDKVWWPRLGVCWTDGFAAVEDALLVAERGDSMLSRLAGAYRAWALAHCDRSDEAVALFHSLTRETEGLLHDPYGGFYNYLYSAILPKEGRRDRDDRLTVLGKAVKFVQERNSRIEDYHDKVRFLQANDWNRRLMEAARGHNLV